MIEIKNVENRCGCKCQCHDTEDKDDWPGPCAACCEPGDMCICGDELAKLLIPRSTYPNKFTDPEYTKGFYETSNDKGTTG